MAIGVSLWIGKKERKKKKEEEKGASDVTFLWRWVLVMFVYLPKCHGNSISITWKHPKCVFNFYNSSLKNQRIERWKQKLKTNPNKPLYLRTHQFWVMGDENRVMGDGWWKITNPNNPCWDTNFRALILLAHSQNTHMSHTLFETHINISHIYYPNILHIIGPSQILRI